MRSLRLALALALAASNVGAAQIHLEYDAYYRFLRIAALTSEFALEPTTYRLAMTIRTMGIVGALAPWTLHTESNGNLDSTGVQPLAHRSDSVYSGDRWVVTIAYAGAESPRVRIEDPEDRRDERDEVPDELRTDTVDPLSATVAVSRAVAERGDCTTTQRIFDGRVRYDLRYEDLGTVELEPSERRVYSGPAHLCRSTLSAIAGFRPRARYGGDSLVTRTWIAPPRAGAVLTPVEIEMTGKAGTLRIYLRDVVAAAP